MRPRPGVGPYWKRAGMQQLRSGEANGAVAPRRRILICDDECEIADMVASLMEREGFSCRACYDPPAKRSR